MRHPTEGVLRRLVDEPAGVSDADRRHVTDCIECLTELAAVREDARLVATALAVPAAPPVDVDAAWQRLSSSAGSDVRPESKDARVRARTPRPGRVRDLVRRPAVAVLAAAVVVAGAGTAAANDWLQIFRTEKITPISLRAADLVAMPDLTAYGDVSVTGGGDPHEVADAASAKAATGLDAPSVDALPQGVSGDPAYQVIEQVSATFTFSTGRAARAAAEAGEQLPTPPAGVDGSRVRLDAGPGLAEVWRSTSGVPALVVGRAVAPTAFSSGVPFETVRDYLLSMPGMPEDVATQLRTFAADGSTLPLPVPSDEVTTSATDVNGSPATVLRSRDKTIAAVVWVDDGVVTAVAGSLDPDEVLSIARGLR